MKLKKILAAVAATAVAVSTMAVSAFALVNKVEPITLNSGDENGKAVQYNLGCFDVGEINTVQIIGKLPSDTWYGGGGALGFDNKDKGEWVQIDFELGKDDAYKVDDSGNMDVTLDFAAASKNGAVNMDKEDGLVQLGWWWGSGDGTVSITDILVNGESIMGKEVAAPAETEAETTEAAPEETEAAPEETEAAPEAEEAEEEVDVDVDEEDADVDEEPEEEAAPVETEAAPVEEAPVAETATPAPATGNTAAAAIVAVMAVAGVAAVATKKRK